MADFAGGVTVNIDTDGMGTFAAINGVITSPDIGKTNPLLDTTDFDSAAREYIPGLADGNEFSLTCHEDLTSATNTNLELLKTKVDNGENVDMQVVLTDGTDTTTYAFTVTPLSWILPGGGRDEVRTVEFTCKISGAITKS